MAAFETDGFSDSRSGETWSGFRQARPEDGALLAHLIAMAGEGLPLWIWSGLAESDPELLGLSPLEVGRRRAMRATGTFSYRNALILEAPRPPRAGGFGVLGSSVASLAGGRPGAPGTPLPQVAGMLLGYRLDPAEAAAEPSELASLPAPLRPLAELEAVAEREAQRLGTPGSWYLNALAVLPAFQGRGLGARLLARALAEAELACAGHVSLIVDADNRVADALYRSRGFREAARRPIVPWPDGPTGDWVLLTRPI